jgi:hypothetical protein
MALVYAQEPGKRTSFTIPLAKLNASFDEDTRVFDNIKVSFDNDDNHYYIIAPGIDYEVKIEKEGRQKIAHNEAPDKAYMISDFEADILLRVTKTFCQTLDIFESDLQHERWDRLLYLDSYFPRFLKGFYYLYSAARSSPYALPKSDCIADSLYDVSLTSLKSDERIRMWRTQKDHILKLRIITKELIFQIKDWQKKELDNDKRNKEISYGKKVEEAYTLFIRAYFCDQNIPDDLTGVNHL